MKWCAHPLQIEPRSPAVAAGLRERDLLVEVNGRRVLMRVVDRNSR
ncbi:MAG: PDZ domain-containing protein [Gemmatimonadota bacterium]|nr:PDZ domain-containing protein [Gemmatimonadota bacterium]